MTVQEQGLKYFDSLRKENLTLKNSQEILKPIEENLAMAECLDSLKKENLTLKKENLTLKNIGTFCTQKLVNFYKDLGTKSNVYIDVTFCTQKLVIFQNFCTKSNVYIIVTFCTQILVIAWFLQESGYKK